MTTPPTRRYAYERDGQAIYRESFATIRREADLSTLPESLHTAAVRIIHAAGDVDIVFNTPSGQHARADGYAIRAATTAMDKPIVTTVQQLTAAVQAIEARMHGELRVKPLQEHARDLDLYGVGR